MNVRLIRLFVLCFALLLVAGGIMLQQPAQTLANPDTTIDDFGTAQTLDRTGIGSIFSFVNGADMIGGQREVTLTVEAIGSANQSQVDINGGGLSRLSQSQGTNVIAHSIHTYDGTSDSGAAGVNPTGLGGVNLRANSDNVFVVAVHSNNFGFASDKITITVYSDATHCSYQVKQLPFPPVIAGQPTVALVFPYANPNSFSTCAGYSAADFTSVGAVQIQLTGGTSDNDIALEFVRTTRLDYGDLPNSTPDYSDITLLANNGAAHVINTLKLGSNIDAEDDGQQNASDAKKDNTTGSPNDEDGVALMNGQTQWNASGTNTFNAIVTGGNACLFGWIDWGNNGAFNTGTEYVVQGVAVVPGNNTITVNVPVGTSASGVFYSRWRLMPRNDSGGAGDGTCDFSSTNFVGSSATVGQFADGEVEDHRFGFDTPTAVTLNEISATVESNQWLQLGALGVLAAATIAFVTMRRK